MSSRRFKTTENNVRGIYAWALSYVKAQDGEKKDSQIELLFGFPPLSLEPHIDLPIAAVKGLANSTISLKLLGKN